MSSYTFWCIQIPPTHQVVFFFRTDIGCPIIQRSSAEKRQKPSRFLNLRPRVRLLCLGGQGSEVGDEGSGQNTLPLL